MADKRNALAELAETLDAIMPYVTVGCEVCAIDRHLTSKRAKGLVVKAQRIVAELAKVRDCTFKGNPRVDQSADAVIVCRAIAEEGVNNEGK